MKFLIAFAAIMAVAAAVYVTPVAHHTAIAAYNPYVASPAIYGAHHYLHKRGIVAPLAYHGAYAHGAYAHVAYTTPYAFGAHHLYKRGIYAAPLAYHGAYAHSAYVRPYAGALYGAHHLYKRGIYAAPLTYNGATIAHTAYNTPFVPRYYF